MWIAATIFVGGALLLAYVLIEKRINQRRCLVCGYSASVDALPEHCPKCGSTISEREEDPG
jgi:rubrerythrin